MKHEGDYDINRDWCFGTVTKGLFKWLEGMEVGDEWKPSKLQHSLERLEYWEESWRLKETCCYSNSSEEPLAKSGGKKFQ